MIEPPRWSEQQLEDSRQQAIEIFREERLAEPLDDYLEVFDEPQGNVEELLEATVDLSELEGAARELVTNPQFFEAFRYLAGPPISEDDLKILADVPSLSKRQLKDNPQFVERVLHVVKQVLDRRRFPWVVECREPTEAERAAAVTASAALMAVRRIETKRRNEGKDKQEELVKNTLLAIGLKEVPRRTMSNTLAAPALGEFCAESKLGKRKADFVIRLWDGRLMPIECKVSNSYLNSVKRLNNDAAGKAGEWRDDFGRRQVVPAAVLSGVYKLHNLENAQDRGLAIFWAHDLKPFTEWILKTKTA